MTEENIHTKPGKLLKDFTGDHGNSGFAEKLQMRSSWIRMQSPKRLCKASVLHGQSSGREKQIRRCHARDALTLFFYFFLNFALTVLNKLLLEKIKFPYLLTGLHAGASWLGCAFLGKTPASGQIQMEQVEHVKLVLFSILYSANIGISNVSLDSVPISLHQLLRAITPATTVLLLRLLNQKHYSLRAYVSLTLVILGVAIATTSQTPRQPFYDASLSGIMLTLLGAFLASLKSVIASTLQMDKSARGKGASGLGLGAIQLVRYISPLALAQSFFFAWIAGEFVHVPLPSSFLALDAGDQGAGFNGGLALLLVLNCLVAFGLNIASFEANRRIGALGITIAGNVKQVLIVVLETMRGGKEWTWARWLGVLGTVVGSCWFAVEEGQRKQTVKKVKPKVKIDENMKDRVLEEGGEED